MLGVKREEDATVTALFSFVLRNLDGEGRQIDDYEKSHWYQPLTTLDSRRFHDNTKQKQ